MKILAPLFVSFLLVTSSYSQSRMTDREMEGLFGKVKAVKIEWREVTALPGRKPKEGLLLIQQDLFALDGQIFERNYPNGHKTVYKVIDGVKTFTSVTVQPPKTDVFRTARVDGDIELPIEKPEKLTEPDLRYDFRLTYEYDDEGRVKAERQFGNNGKLLYLKTFKYDTNGRIVEEIRNDTIAITKNTYTYDKKGLVIESVVDRNIKGKGSDSTTKRIYSNYVIDSQGNWTTRQTQIFYSDQGVPEYKIVPAKYDYINAEYRTITYY